MLVHSIVGNQILFRTGGEYRSRFSVKMGVHIQHVATDEEHTVPLQQFFDSHRCNVKVVDIETVKMYVDGIKSGRGYGDNTLRR